MILDKLERLSHFEKIHRIGLRARALNIQGSPEENLPPVN